MEDGGVLRRCGSSQRQHMLGKHPIWFLQAELWLGLGALRLHLLIVHCNIGEVCDDYKKVNLRRPMKKCFFTDASTCSVGRQNILMSANVL